MGLDEDAVDVVDVDGPIGGADGFEHRGEAEIAGLAQDAVAGTDDKVDGGLGEGVVAQADAVEFAMDVDEDLFGNAAFVEGGADGLDHRIGVLVEEGAFSNFCINWIGRYPVPLDANADFTRRGVLPTKAFHNFYRDFMEPFLDDILEKLNQ